MIDAKMNNEARAAIIKTGDFLSVVPSAQINTWKESGAIFTVNQDGVELIPKYLLDPTNKYLPNKSVSEVIKLFGTLKDSWGLAIWFGSVNGFLGGARPQDIIEQAPEKLLAAARDAIEDMGGVSHG